MAEETNSENSFEYSPEIISYLKLIRNEFSKFLNEYSNEFPDEEVHGKLEKKYKCQKHWFGFLPTIDIIRNKLEKGGRQNNEIAKLAKKADELVYETKEDSLAIAERQKELVKKLEESGLTIGEKEEFAQISERHTLIKKEYIDCGDEILKAVIKELDKIIGE